MRAGWIGVLLLAIVLGSVSAPAPALAAAETGELRALVSESLGPPLLLDREGPALDGLLPDIYRELALRLGLRLRLVSATRRRLVRAGLGTDLWCHTAPRWMSADEAAQFVWSQPLYARANLIVAPRRPGAPPPPAVDLQTMTGTVATGLGYAYPGLDDAFANGRLVRSDTRNETMILEKVAAARADLGIINDLVHAWHLRTQPDLADRLAVVGEVDTVPVACALAPDGPHREAILDALAAMSSDGTVDRLLQRWGHTGGPS